MVTCGQYRKVTSVAYCTCDHFLFDLCYENPIV